MTHLIIIVTSGDKVEHRTEMLRGWLSEEQTAELTAMLEEDDCSLHGVLLAAGLLAVARVLQDGEGTEKAPPVATLQLRATHEANLRSYCPAAPKMGCLTTYYESDYSVPPITDRADFWRFSHELTVKHNLAKNTEKPLQALRIYGKAFAASGNNDDFLRQSVVRNEMGLAVYGDLGSLYRREHLTSTSVNKDDGWDKPLFSLGGSAKEHNLRLEDVFHATGAHDMGSPFTHTAHLLNGRVRDYATKSHPKLMPTCCS